MALDHNLKLYKFDIVDDQARPFTTDTTVTIETASVAETIYSDRYKTAKSNPITGTIVGGIIEFYSYKAAIDVRITTTDGTSRHAGVTISDARLVVITHLESEGTTSETFQIDSNSSGPKLKNNSGSLDIRNEADDAYAPLMASVITGTSAIFSTTMTGALITAGASGTIGIISTYPATASKGKLSFVASDSAGDTNTSITNASQAGARTYTIPDAGGDADFLMDLGAQLVGGAKTLTEGAAVAAVALRLGATATEGMEVKVIDETVDLSGGTAASFDLTEDVPDGAVILCASMNLETTIDAVTATKVGLGTADPDKYGITADLIQNSKSDVLPDWAVLSGAEDIKIYAVNNAGAAAGTIGGGGDDSVRVRIVYLACNSLDDT